MEIWRTIENHPNYEVSNEGRVRRADTGDLVHLSPHSTSGGYRVTLDGHRYYVHRLTAKAFLDTDGTDYVRHKNDNAKDNRVSNLEIIVPEVRFKPRLREKIVRCSDCVHRYESDFCRNRPDDFYCADGESADF